MGVLICEVCGGKLDVNGDVSITTCDYCDSVITIPRDLDRKENLYNRAVFHRLNSEFDKAVSAYEDILKEDNTDAEAHWGLVLSKFGIEYVLDPQTGEYIPTCHRTQTESILTDPDYLAALEYGDFEASHVFEMQARRINEIQAKILEISRKEPPYDIFICYKESDDMGNRTIDSALAQDLYYQLIKKEYKVFFARKTLESKLGTEYEPIIFAALNSAKIMIVLGTKPEHFNAVWVRNEWSRFSKLAKNSNKVIIPAYRGMSPYELPDELSLLQSQDMSKIGFMQDLTDGIEKIMKGSGIKKTTVKKEITDIGFGSVPLERLLQNAQTYLRLNNYPLAEEVYNTVIKDYPEDYRGWWGLIVCKTRSFAQLILDGSELNVWFGYVKQLADPKDFGEVEKEYIEYARKVSSLAATDDMKAVNNIIQGHNEKIRSLQQSILSTTSTKSTGIQKFNKQTIDDNNKILICENELASNKANLETWKARALIGSIIIAIGVIVLFFGGWSILYGIIIGIVGISTCSSASNNGTKKEIEKRISDSEKELSRAKEIKTQNHADYNRGMARIEAQIFHYEQAITDVQGEIENCNRYLNLGKDRISTLWFSKRCEEFGVQQPFEDSIGKYRKAAFGAQEEVVDEIVTITCPACEGQIRKKFSELHPNGHVTCNTCGSGIQVNIRERSNVDNTVAGENVDNTVSEECETSYEVDCPSCNEKFDIEESVLSFGQCNCPNCGMTIEFEDAP